MENLKYYIDKALKEGFALGAFNFSNMENLKGICKACEDLKSPVIVAVSESSFKYMNEHFIMALIDSARKTYDCPIFLHLDHGKTFEMCKKAVDVGFDSVMIDGSSLSFEENIEITKKVVEYAHSKNVLVEAELGVLSGVEDEVSAEQNIYTDPQMAKTFVDSTNCDTLAVAIGTSHGAYKYSGNQTLRFDILSQIEELLPNYPLVLHGASTVNKELVDKINQYGGNIKNSSGIPEELIKEAVTKHNVIKVNSDTDLRLAMIGQIRELLSTDPSNFNFRDHFKSGENKINEVVSGKIISLLCSNNKY
ncbi:MAG: ketose-bisphosphate aldolase [Clostridia bacterium]|nr:ketose-bisphosphate aldolase [Clostridia bacterium]